MHGLHCIHCLLQIPQSLVASMVNATAALVCGLWGTSLMICTIDMQNVVGIFGTVQ